MSLFQRKGSPFWQYDFTVKGVRFRGSTGEQKKQAARQVEDRLRSKAAKQRTYKEKWRLRDLLGAYWSEHGKDTLAADNIFRSLAHLTRLLGTDTKVMDMTNAILLNYRAKRRGEGVQPQTVNREFSYLKAAMNRASRLHQTAMPSIDWKILRAKEPPNRVRYLTREEYDLLMDVAHPRIRPIIAFAVMTGLRKENILSLEWPQVDMGGGWVRVTVKGDKRHAVRLTASAKAVIASLSNDRAKVFDTLNFRKLWEQAVKKSELQDFRFHDLRHTFASWARQAGADIADICEALGHSDISVTMKYAHIKADEHITAFDRVSDSFTTQSTAHWRIVS